MTTKVGIYPLKAKGSKKWIVRWFGRYDPATGKQKRHSKRFEKKKDAEKFQRRKQTEFDNGMTRDVSNETLRDYTEQWLQNKASIHRATTTQLYRETFVRLYSYFGQSFVMRKIDRRMAKAFLADVKPLKGTKALSSWTNNRVLRHCKTLFSEAVEDRVINDNPFRKIKKAKALPSKWYYLSPQEYEALLESTNSLAKRVLYTLYYTAGLRLTEALALKWNYVDFENGLIQIVNQPATETLPPFLIKDTEERVIPISRHTLNLLWQQESQTKDLPYVVCGKTRLKQIKDKWQRYQASGREWKNRDYANNILRDFKADYKRAGIKPTEKFTVHTLRKCCIQNWANVLPMNVVKELAGHSDISTTAKFYSTVSDHHLKQAARITDDLLTRLKEESDPKMTFLPDFAEKR